MPPFPYTFPFLFDTHLTGPILIPASGGRDMALAGALAKLYDLEASVSITAPVSVSTRRVYHFMPVQNETLAEFPCFLNEVTFGVVDQRRLWAQREYDWSVQITCAVAPAGVEDDARADTAAAFFEAFFELMCQNVGLNTNASVALVRGGQPTIGIIQYGGRAYMGFTCFLDIRYEQAYLWGR